ncbi:MAG: dTDP-4-dehydrorhamnose 3,5-epimerase [Endomicrobium sp.]|jgi:dTDP-4-dehydrorhamnose 3,5-epimerase|nr:dTDP-4-dehydrorhamnose 3,5-epimerase [Endomicrobium sp.]
MAFKFTKLSIPEVVLIESEKYEDSRGFFAELYQENKFKEFGIDKPVKQINLSKSSKGVLRGLHYQLNPFAQGKIVRVVAGSIFDVAVDLRKGSRFFGKWAGVNLKSENLSMLYIPEGFAHGFEVLSDTAEFEYLCTQTYSPQHERGIRYDDPSLNISWSSKTPVISEKDLKHPFLKDAEINF